MDQPTDASLAVAARQGDDASFATIMRRHKGWLYQFIRRYVADRDEAYDVLQETFVSAWSARATSTRLSQASVVAVGREIYVAVDATQTAAWRVEAWLARLITRLPGGG